MQQKLISSTRGKTISDDFAEVKEYESIKMSEIEKKFNLSEVKSININIHQLGKALEAELEMMKDEVNSMILDRSGLAFSQAESGLGKEYKTSISSDSLKQDGQIRKFNSELSIEKSSMRSRGDLK
jgi:hypothetical protein